MIAVGTERAQPQTDSGADARGGTVLGAVLCGGLSQRMGEDKALLEFGADSLLGRAAGILGGITNDVVLAVGAQDRYEEFGRLRVLDRAPGLGPLAGLEAALGHAQAVGASTVCVLACDMPGVRSEDFDEMLRRLHREDADACIARSPRGLEPLFGVYHRRILPVVRRALDRGGRSLRCFHPQVRVLFHDVVRPDEVLNLNTRDEFEKAKRDFFELPPMRRSTPDE